VKDKIFYIKRLWDTLKYLKCIQVYSRIRLKWRDNKYELLQAPGSVQLSLKAIISTVQKYIADNSFSFLNLQKRFGSQIEWEFPDYGRLWTYNLNYFEYLLQDNIQKEEGLNLIYHYIDNLPKSKTGIEPYPLSLRSIYWIQFLTKFQIKEQKIDDSLYSQLQLLTKKIEYHLLGNHLVENGCSLLFGAYYFHDKGFYQKAKKIITKELKEQILADGAHFELSPMYHAILLHRVLDCYNLVVSNNIFDKELEPLLKQTAGQMLAWLNNVTYKNGNIPLVNDAAFCIAPTFTVLKDYADRLDVKVAQDLSLGESGYRKYESGKFELFVDSGNIGPDYQPGHAHADTFNFELYINGRPVIIDTGTSTYEKNNDRFYERSTAAHNTVVIAGKNSSEVWAGHRVGRRAKIAMMEESYNMISAKHNGYEYLKQSHERKFEINDRGIVIIDNVTHSGVAYFHFAPAENITVLENNIKGKDFEIMFCGAGKIELLDSFYSPEFNRKDKRKSIRISFDHKLETYIR
jgi:hypothetical protein